MTALMAPMSRRKYVIAARMNEQTIRILWSWPCRRAAFGQGRMLCWRSTASAAFKSVAAKDGMTTVNSTSGIVSPIRHMPMRSVIGLVVSG
jgi:hypothetical protein